MTESRMVPDETLDLVERIRKRLKEAQDLDALIVLEKENEKLANLVFDIDQVIASWAIEALRKIATKMCEKNCNKDV